MEELRFPEANVESLIPGLAIEVASRSCDYADQSIGLPGIRKSGPLAQSQRSCARLANPGEVAPRRAGSRLRAQR
ncbi:hypothetical protein MC885_020524 [Smutsia gigantea]|nr:hypothetical protein MC885_020524 [Smutsia gigantea]